MAVSRSRRPAGIAFLIAGAVFLLILGLNLANVVITWLPALAYLPLAAGFLILAFASVTTVAARITAVAAGVGWLLLAVNESGLGLPLPLVNTAALVAGIGGLLTAIIMFVSKDVRNPAAVVFIATTALALMSILDVVGALLLDTIGTIVAVVHALGLVITGFLFTRSERSKP